MEDFNAYVHRRDSLLRTPRGRVALLKGGIVWRLAVEVIGVDECLDGPSVETLVHRRGLVYPTDDPSFDLCDDDLSTVELDIICGVYICFTGELHSLIFLCISSKSCRAKKSVQSKIVVPATQHLGSNCTPKFLD